MRAGKLRKRIDIQQSTPTQNSLGEMIPSWSNFATNIPAEVIPLTGTERIIGQQTNTKLTSQVAIRYMTGITSQMRVIFGTRTLQIEGFANMDERDRQITLYCSESER